MALYALSRRIEIAADGESNSGMDDVCRLISWSLAPETKLQTPAP